MNAATKGPWWVDPNPPKYARIRSPSGWIVARVGNNENTDEQTYADAKLIAAAPLLADALELALKHMFHDTYEADFEVVRNAARAALRAAGRIP